MKRLFGFAVFTVSTLVAAEVSTLDEAKTLLADGRAQAALEKISSHVAANPTDSAGRFLLGLALAETGETNGAIKVFEALTLDDPSLAEPYNNLAVLRAQRGEYYKARGALEDAVRTHPNYGTAHENLGDIYTILATAAFNKALSLNSQNNALKVKLEMLGNITNVSTAEESPAQLADASKNLMEKPISSDTLAAASGVNEPRAREEKQISDALTAWAEAWSRKNLPRYLGAYAASFEPPKNLDRASWETQRSERISEKQGEIRVSVSNRQIRFVSNDLAVVTFVQGYNSATYSDKVTKSMLLANENGTWRILREQAL